jgi:hypothetical protein
MVNRLASAARITTLLLIAAALLFSLAMAWNISGWPVSLAEAMIFAAAGITAIRASAVAKVRFPGTAVTLFAACLWVAGQLCLGGSVYRFGTFQSLLIFLSIACAYWSILQLLESNTALHAAQIFLVVLGSATAALSILYLLTSNGRVYWVIDTLDSWRPMGPFLNANHNAVFMELLLPLALWNALNGLRRGYLYAAAAALMYSSVIAGASRAGFIIASIEILILLFHSLARKNLRQGAVAAGAVLLAILIAGAALSDWSTVLRRFHANDVFQQRRELLHSTLEMIRDHPMAGSGLGTWAIVYPKFAIFEPGLAVYHAHNEWAEWMAEGGVIFVVLLWSVVVRAVLLIRKYPWGLGIAAGAIHAFVDFPFHVYPDLLCFFLIAALMEAVTLKATHQLVSGRILSGQQKTDCECRR